MTSIPSRQLLLVVIVLYKRDLKESTSYQSLIESFREIGSNALDLRVLIWDNTPSSLPPNSLPHYVDYVSSSHNEGLVVAYELAWRRALASGFEWLLTLDQDTVLPETFLSRTVALLNRIANYQEIAAIVPQLLSGKDVLSPYYFAFGAWPRHFPLGYSGVSKATTFGFNSGALLRVTALKQIGGYDLRFWLDNSDAALFQKLAEYGKKIYVHGDLQIAHEFSMHKFREKVSLSRYYNVLLAETAFWDLKMNRLAGIERLLRLIIRNFKHLRNHDPERLKAVTREFIRRRLMLSRNARLALWNQEVAFHGTKNDESEPSATTRPTVSVCMAAYNGGPHIAPQLASILAQLSMTDEVIVVDDCSTDGTREWLRSLQDPRVRLIEQIENSGVVKSFEKALRCAVGQILFLADNDDLWHQEKIGRFLAAFESDPQVSLVISAITLIDSHGNPSEDYIDVNHMPFSSSFWANIYKNRFQGSAMAIRASLLGDILPFPQDNIFLHDAWIGTRSALLKKKMVYLPEQLLFYRRHSSNFSRRLPRRKQVVSRLQLLSSHLRRFIA